MNSTLLTMLLVLCFAATAFACYKANAALAETAKLRSALESAVTLDDFDPLAEAVEALEARQSSLERQVEDLLSSGAQMDSAVEEDEYGADDAYNGRDADDEDDDDGADEDARPPGQHLQALLSSMASALSSMRAGMPSSGSERIIGGGGMPGILGIPSTRVLVARPIIATVPETVDAGPTQEAVEDDEADVHE